MLFYLNCGEWSSTILANQTHNSSVFANKNEDKNKAYYNCKATCKKDKTPKTSSRFHVAAIKIWRPIMKNIKSSYSNQQTQ